MQKTISSHDAAARDAASDPVPNAGNAGVQVMPDGSAHGRLAAGCADDAGCGSVPLAILAETP